MPPDGRVVLAAAKENVGGCEVMSRMGRSGVSTACLLENAEEGGEPVYMTKWSGNSAASDSSSIPRRRSTNIAQ